MVRYLHPADNHSVRNKDVEKLYGDKLDFEDIKLSVKFRDIHQIERKKPIDISVSDYENKKKYPISVSQNCCEDKHVDLLLIEERDKKYYVFIKDFNIFMY